jgi:hypothetical protein
MSVEWTSPLNVVCRRLRELMRLEAKLPNGKPVQKTGNSGSRHEHRGLCIQQLFSIISKLIQPRAGALATGTLLPAGPGLLRPLR